MQEPSDLDAPEDLPDAPKIRLQRFLAACGLGSRRACEEFITQGRVTVDGVEVTELGTTVNPSVQKIVLDGDRLRMERKKYFLFNKPTGVLCTNSDPKRRPRVVDFFPDAGPRLFTVGRLDEDSEGLLLVTNDGDLAQRMAHPKYRIYRTYLVQVAGFPTREIFDQMKKGIFFPEGKFKVIDVRSVKRQGQSMWLEVVLSEGHNREIRRLFAKMGHKVMRLERIAFGPLSLGKLKRGEFRELRHEELERLHAVLAKAQSQARTPRSAGRVARGEGRGAEGSGAARPARTSRPKSAPRVAASEAIDDYLPEYDAPASEHPALPSRVRPAKSRSGGARPIGDRPVRDRSDKRGPIGDRPAKDRPAGDRPFRDRSGKNRATGDVLGGDRPAKGAPAKFRPRRATEAAGKRAAPSERRFSKSQSSGEAKRRPQRRKKPRRGEGKS